MGVAGRILNVAPLSDEWFELRSKAITATDVPKILGQSSWGTALDVWMRLTGKVDERTKAEDTERKPWLEWGNRTEELHRNWVAELTGKAICSSPGLVQHPDLDWLLCTPDGLYGDSEQVFASFDANGGEVDPSLWIGNFETKSPSPFNAFDPSQGVPLMYAVQVQVQMACLGMDETLVSSLHWPEPKYAFVPAHAGFQEQMIETLLEFKLEHVDKDIPPEVSADDVKTLERLFPASDGTVVSLPPELAHDCQRWVELTEQISGHNAKVKELDTARKKHRAEIQLAIGNGTYGLAPDGLIFKCAFIERAAVEATRFRQFRTVKEIKEA